MIDFETMKQKAASFCVNLNEEQLLQLDQYAEMLVDWNTRMNLTGITDSEGIMTRHFEDSLSLLAYAQIPEGAKVIDVGTGAGFPGVVLKIARPDIQLTLLDSLQKRLLFLDAVVHQIHVEARIAHMRAEEGSRIPKMREQYDIACARAVANLRELAEYCLPYVKGKGYFVSMKGPDVAEEVASARNAIDKLGGKLVGLHEFSISDGSKRSIIVVKKMKQTPSQYPRPYAKIAKNPL